MYYRPTFNPIITVTMKCAKIKAATVFRSLWAQFKAVILENLDFLFALKMMILFCKTPLIALVLEVPKNIRKVTVIIGLKVGL